MSAVIWGLSFAAGAVLILANIVMGDLNQDEGWYLYAGGLVAESIGPLSGLKPLDSRVKLRRIPHEEK
mgnify:CR=1 FL=1